MQVTALKTRYDLNVAGIQVSVPSWTKYIAINENGIIVAFSMKPLCDSEMGMWVPDYSTKSEVVPVQIEFEANDIHWMDTLIEVKDGNIPPLIEVVS